MKIQIASEEEKSHEETNQFLDLAFGKIREKTQQQPSFFVNAESFINEAVSVGARMKYFYVLQCLSLTVCANFDDLSFIAIKGIKTFIQILNPQKYEEWKDVTGVLIEIMNASRTKNIKAIEDIKKEVSDLNIMELI